MSTSAYAKRQTVLNINSWLWTRLVKCIIIPLLLQQNLKLDHFYWITDSDVTVDQIFPANVSDNTVISAPSSPSNLSSVTLVGSTGSGSNSGSDRSPQDGGTYSRGVSEETDTPVATETTTDGKFEF